ncbi:hypothetical protein F2Q68_00016771 [Brassica cretica]|uniref:Uncharacterized protein n=1 Tax=Brassica cretica TaxID=69181 RepID=A0A8S9HQH7_BRACR|nr:hypothetical protein F2Q68_00016771 [Brassica cretica]
MMDMGFHAPYFCCRFSYVIAKVAVFPSRSASGSPRMYVSVLFRIVGNVAGIQVDMLDFIDLCLSSGFVKSSFLPQIFVDPRGRTTRVLAVKAENIYLNSSSVAALAVALAADTAASGVF